MEDLPRQRHEIRGQRRQTLLVSFKENKNVRIKVQPIIYVRKLKAQRLRWTTAWRRLHKKIKQSDQGKLKKKKAMKLERAIEGVSLEAIKKMKTAKAEDKKAIG